MPRYFLELQYEGTNFHGWQRQPNATGVQAVIEDALATLLRVETPILGSGRTDAGVHALQQWAHFEAEEKPILAHLPHKLHSLLPKDIAILSLHKMTDEAHARFDATSRSYRYYVHQQRNPFLRFYSYYYYRHVDIDLMNEAASLLLSYTNFRPFSKSNTDVKTYNCDIREASWRRLENGQLEFHIRADRFLRGMVRLITGTLLNIGAGRMSKEQLIEWLEAGEPVLHKHHAGAEGLYLCEVEYPKALFLEKI